MASFRDFLVAGFLAVSIHLPASAETPMTVFMETEPQKRLISKFAGGGLEAIYLKGEITEGSTDRFLAYVQKHRVEAALVHFDSPGGSLGEGLRLGKAIRALGFSTTIGSYEPKYVPGRNEKAICASACAYAFAGGVSRFVSEYTGRLGIHQFYSAKDKNIPGSAVQQVSGAIVEYLDDMGVDAKAFTLSTSADSKGMVWLSPEEALKLRFANNGKAAPTAEIKIEGMNPYLRIEQEHHDTTARVLFICENSRLTMLFGIVLEPATSAMIAGNQKRSYLELDDKEFGVAEGATGAKARDSVVWITRNITRNVVTRIIQATVLGGWVDGFGAVRYGATLDLPTVRDKLLNFANQCFMR